MIMCQCPHYFMNNVNLFESVPVEDREKLLNSIETNVVPSETDYYTINPLGKNVNDTNDEYWKAVKFYSTNNINKDFLHDIIHAVQVWDTLLSQYFASTKGTDHLDHLLLVLFVFKAIDGNVPLKHLHRRQIPDHAPERPTKSALRRWRRERLEVRIASGSGSRKKPPALQSSVRLATPRRAIEEPVVIEPRPCFSPRGDILEGFPGESPDARTPDRVSVESFSADSTEEGMLLDRSPDNGVSDLDELAAHLELDHDED
ncbi:unnamed protein product [Didymodactylos carnosus]|uniref:Uncharacterized protein n=1 Tax=Didymodactylos carnosus TaxID=1234261 RepID=A0A815JBV7_9BILA|nr:unnamed protein product [Didymodactylos carnosus]CAF4268673.1 unnamed protein product [Didymodactylos carnosus]